MTPEAILLDRAPRWRLFRTKYWGILCYRGPNSAYGPGIFWARKGRYIALFHSREMAQDRARSWNRRGRSPNMLYVATPFQGT